MSHNNFSMGLPVARLHVFLTQKDCQKIAKKCPPPPPTATGGALNRNHLFFSLFHNPETFQLNIYNSVLAFSPSRLLHQNEAKTTSQIFNMTYCDTYTQGTLTPAHMRLWHLLSQKTDNLIRTQRALGKMWPNKGSRFPSWIKLDFEDFGKILSNMVIGDIMWRYHVVFLKKYFLEKKFIGHFSFWIFLSLVHLSWNQQLIGILHCLNLDQTAPN